DRTPPETTITTGPSGSTQSPSAQFAFAASQNRSTFQCSLDGSAWASCASPKPYGGPLSDGQHTFAVRAIDASGNVGPTPAARTWSVEAPPSPPGDLHVTGYGPNTINLAWTASTDN